ncbi:hypothetical protein MKW98_019132, partial [Papaver atlanticum]
FGHIGRYWANWKGLIMLVSQLKKEDLMDDEEATEVLHEVYGYVEEVDILVELLAGINGFAIIETNFFKSTIMASR